MKNPTPSARNFLFLAMVCALLPFGTACFENDDPVDRAAAVSKVTGTWNGVTSLDENMVLSLNQTLVTVTGNARIGNITGALTGTIDGNRFEATIQPQPVRIIFATAEGDFMSGTIRDFTGNILSNFNAQRR